MKFGVLQFFSWPERRVELTTVYERALERIEVMDRSGYDAVGLAEHHFSGYSVCPSGRYYPAWCSRRRNSANFAAASSASDQASITRRSIG